ncbi:MAG: hypothetical protein F2903_09165 [Actinobacteria bacterium]|nr:hypothetical protein [Actinomycetota bacterium]
MYNNNDDYSFYCWNKRQNYLTKNRIKSSMSSKRTPCPKFQSKKSLPIQQGMPSIEIAKKCEADKLELLEVENFMPLSLEFSIGGYSGPCHNVKLKKGTLTYQYTDGGNYFNPLEATTVIPTKRKWINFKKKLDIIEVWGWDAPYEDHRVLDGTQWELEIDYGRKKISASGSNSYPGANNEDMLLDWEDTPVFDNFLRALNLLLGGTKIQ